ncbi:MAG: type 2 isopentenyl-diphosphate Delta-isomerase [Candidatus Bathyarchaeia archaeon]|jgi:isopentenyl-diphosphate delta-isomerase
MPDSLTTKRKLSHIQTTLHQDVQSHVPTGFDDVRLVHRALPEIDRDEIDLSTEIFGHRMNAPLIIESMTGGTPMAAKINRTLAKVAQNLGIGMGVGSQRAAIEDQKLAYTYRVARDAAPSIPLFANLGCPQLSREDAVERAKKAVDMIDANGLFIHLNALQESVQYEGETNFSKMLQTIGDVVRALSVPVLVKETGAGISSETARETEAVGVKGINVSGLGGTSWSAVEYYRAKEKRQPVQIELGKTFWDWGTPTVASIVEVAATTHLKVFASGGVRNGLHIAKALALGGHYGGLALPMLKSATAGERSVIARLTIVVEELRNALFLTGSRNIEELRKAPLVITGDTYLWLSERGFDPTTYAIRRKS